MRNTFVIIAAFCLIVISCESESHLVYNSPENNLGGNSKLVSKLLRVSQYPTAIDNIVDGSSCFALELPVTVFANGIEVNIDTTNDYQLVRDIFDMQNNDTDSVALQFPLTVVFPDYCKTVLATQDDYDSIISNCKSSSELSCIGLNYPLKMEWYDTRNEAASTFNVDDKKALFHFLERIDNEAVVSFSYPIQISNNNGNTATVYSNNALEMTIDSLEDDCVTMSNPNLESILTNSSWYVFYFFRETNQTADYDGFDFIFNADGTTMVTDGQSTSSGTWTINQNGSEQELNFSFSNSQLEELEESWEIIEFTESLIKMEYHSGGSGTRYLQLKRD